MTLRLVPDFEEELLELTKSMEAFHDVYCSDLPYAAVAALQEAIGYEALQRCLRCYMRKYDVLDNLCRSCRRNPNRSAP